MLSDKEKQEMRQMANSNAIREEFEVLRLYSRLPSNRPVDMDQLVDFLNAMSKFGPAPKPRPFIAYTRILL